MTTAKKVDIDKAIAWIDEHWIGQKACPICENTGWFVGDVAGEMREMRPNNLISGPRYPLIVISCSTCGYTLLFNAIVGGLVEGEV